MGNKQASLTEEGHQIQPDDFEFMRLIGRGGFAKVYQVRKRDTGSIYAMKIMQKVAVLRTNMIRHTNLEAEIMGSFGEHPFICKLYYSFQTEDKLCFVLEYFNGGSLWTHLSASDTPFSESLVRFYCQEIIVAMETLHKHDIVYRDLKLENILLDSDGHVHLTDFGLSHKLVKRKNVHSFSGTPAYLAPEILTDQGEGHGKSVDYWSFGILIHLMLTQEPPFWSEDNKTLYKKIMNDKVILRNTDHLSKEAVSLLLGLLTRDPRHRLGVGCPIRDHPFFAGTDWDAVLQKKLIPPFVPAVEGPTDYRYFEKTEEVNMEDLHPLSLEPGSDKFPSLPSNLQKQFKAFPFLPSKEAPVSSSSSSSSYTRSTSPPSISPPTTSPTTSPPVSPPVSPRSPPISPRTTLRSTSSKRLAALFPKLKITTPEG